MDAPTLAALLQLLATAFAVAFQLALALGAPWGHLALGGRHPGRLPPALRAAAVVQGALLATLSVAVASRAGLFAPALALAAPSLAWLAVAVAALSLALNLATPSRGERLLWAPTAAVMLASSLVVAT